MAEKKSGLFTFVACTVQPWGTAWVLSGPAFSIPTMPLTADLGNHDSTTHIKNVMRSMPLDLMHPYQSDCAHVF